MKSYYIHFIRHGAIEETKKGAYIGVTDPELSEEGIRELKSLDNSCKYPYAPVIFTSPLKRCTQTCEILYPHINPITVDELTEMNFGKWEGKTADELRGDPLFESWLAGEEGVTPPGGESNDDFTRRICLMFQNIVDGLIKTGNTDCAIVTHGGIIMTLLAVYGLPQAKPFDWACDNGYGFSMRVTPMLWQRDRVAEVYKLIPEEKDDD
ncbi:MAG: histidine phosphatase family protein [Ruminococcus sp.]|nr:histidine phosphatase family protein [Ruminococcus sp.]